MLRSVINLSSLRGNGNIAVSKTVLLSSSLSTPAKEKSERFCPDFFAVENQKAAISPNPVR